MSDDVYSMFCRINIRESVNTLYTCMSDDVYSMFCRVNIRESDNTL